MTETRNASPDTLVSEDAKELRWALRSYSDTIQNNGKAEHWARIVAIMAKAEAALTPPINDSGEGEPVAWRARHDTQPHRWTLLSARPERPDPHVTVQPLYAAPSPKGKTYTEAEIERAAQALVDHRWNGSQPPFSRKPAGWKVEHMDEVRAVLAAFSNPAQALPDGEAGEADVIGLECVRRQIQRWISFDRDGRTKAGMETPDDAHIVAPPTWPSHGQLKTWVALFERLEAALSKPSSRNGADK